MDDILSSRLKQRQRTLVMAIFNATPDSFYDGGRYQEEKSIRDRIGQLVADGADILDLGAESSRPGARPVPEEEEINRLSPALDAALATGAPVSVDTCKAGVAEYAISRGAAMINDITALRQDSAMAEVIARSGVICVLMHMQGKPENMQNAPRYDDVVGEVYDFLAKRVEFALASGIREDTIWLDPGFGFGKTLEQNLILLRRLEEFLSLGFPILIGTSNKSMIGAVLDAPVDERMEGTAATVALGICKGVHCVRVHDVKTMKRIARMCDAVMGKGADNNV